MVKTEHYRLLFLSNSSGMISQCFTFALFFLTFYSFSNFIFEVCLVVNLTPTYFNYPQGKGERPLFVTEQQKPYETKAPGA